MKPSEILENAALLIRDKGWCRYRLAKDADGDGTTTDSPTAVCFCAMGALNLASKGTIVPHNWLVRILDREDIGEWNDTPGRTRGEVFSALWAAARLAKEVGE